MGEPGGEGGRVKSPAFRDQGEPFSGDVTHNYTSFLKYMDRSFAGVQQTSSQICLFVLCHVLDFLLLKSVLSILNNEEIEFVNLLQAQIVLLD